MKNSLNLGGPPPGQGSAQGVHCNQKEAVHPSWPVLFYKHRSLIPVHYHLALCTFNAEPSEGCVEGVFSLAKRTCLTSAGAHLPRPASPTASCLRTRGSSGRCPTTYDEILTEYRRRHHTLLHQRRSACAAAFAAASNDFFVYQIVLSPAVLWFDKPTICFHLFYLYTSDVQINPTRRTRTDQISTL